MITSQELDNNEVKIDETSNEILDSFMNCYIQHTNDLKDLRDLQNELKRKLTYYVALYSNEKNIDFSRGRLVGIVQLLDMIIEISEKKANVVQDIDNVFAQIKTVSHGSEVIKILSLKRGVQHKELCVLLNITAGTLTGIIDKLCEMNLIYFTKIGKFKFYYLTNFGQKFKEEKCSKPDLPLSKLETELMIEKEKNKRLQKFLRDRCIIPTGGNSFIYFENYFNPVDINKNAMQVTHLLKRRIAGNNYDANSNQYSCKISLRSFQELKG